MEFKVPTPIIHLGKIYASTYILFGLVKPEGPYVEVGKLFFLNDTYADVSVCLVLFFVWGPVLNTHHLVKKDSDKDPGLEIEKSLTDVDL